jgi:hypothetical protein
MIKFIASIFTIAFLLVIYVLPSYIAVRRGHRGQSSIIIINILLGWTLVGWIVALAWSLTGNVKNKRRKR